MKAHWQLPFYHQPDAYFSGQRVGSMYIAEAPHVPSRVASPYMTLAMERMMGVLVALKAHAVARNVYDVEGLLPEARRLLGEAQADLSGRIDRNVLYHAAQ